MLALLGLCAGCAEDAPTAPTWAVDVAPIMVAGCGGCHGAQPAADAPATFRLDLYDPSTTDAGATVLGAGAMAEFAAARAAAGHGDLDETGVATLAAWAARAAPGAAPPRGSRAGNRAPTVTWRLGAPPPIGEPGHERLPLAITVDDRDREAVTGEVRVVDGDAQTLLRIGALHGGANALTLDSAHLRNGAYRLVARLTDPSGTRDVIVGRLDIDHHGSIPPRVAAVAPAAGELVVDGDGPALVQVQVTDLDSSRALVDVALVDAAPGGARVELATDLEVIPGGLTSLAYFPSDLAASDAWRVEATVTGANDETFTVRGPAFAVRHDTTPDGFAAIRDAILAPRCGGCHGPTPRIPELPFDLTSFADVDGRPGASSLRGAMYQRAVASAAMPPPSAALLDGTPPLTDDERARLAAWLGAGAPE